MKTIIIDSGGSTCDWAVLENERLVDTFMTQGMHPMKSDIASITHRVFQKHASVKGADDIYFYGAGTSTPLLINRIKASFKDHLNNNQKLHIESDLLGAARALCGKNRGLVCILGTGSNTAIYDGAQLTKTVASGGYLLGDEGSGYHLSKTLIINYLRNNLSVTGTAIFQQYIKGKNIDLVNSIYTSQKPNAYIASFTQLLPLLPDMDKRNCVLPCFKEFIHKRVIPIQYTDIGLFFTGSIAFHFKKELEEALKTVNLRPEKVEPKPIEALIEYHIENL